MRHEKWKLLCDYDGGRPELYDIIPDPGETKNLEADYSDVTSKLVKLVTEWYPNSWKSKICRYGMTVEIINYP